MRRRNDHQDHPDAPPEGHARQARADDNAGGGVTGKDTANQPSRSNAFLPFLEFPTPKLLREANENFHRAGWSLPRSPEVTPFPARRPKRDIFDSAAYKDIDSRAISAPASLVEGDIKALVSYLLKDVRNEMGKVRAIFRWITAQDLTSHKGTEVANIEETTVLWRLWSLANDKSTYTDLFLEICRSAGIRCAEIGGYVKGTNYEPLLGETGIDWNVGRTVWAAVCIDSHWFMVDAHWSSRHTSGGDSGEWELIDDNGKGRVETESSPEGLQYQLDETYFLTNPEQLIYSHFPIDEKWQLLARPVRLEEFEKMAYLKSAFFDLDLALKDERKCLLHAPDGEVEIQLGVPETKRCYFRYKLWKFTKDDASSDTVTDGKLERFVMMRQMPGILSCRLQFPVTGTFKLDLFGRENKTGLNKLCCRFIIICNKPMDNCCPLPENVRREWGPGLDLLDAGLEAVSHPDATVEAEQGVAKIRFNTNKDVAILHRLHSNTMTTDALENNVIHYFRDGVCVVDLKLPESGDYALNLYAKETGTDGNYSNVCSYVVSSATAALDPTPFPSVANGTFGPLDDNNTYQLKPISHPNPVIEVADDGELEVVFESANTVKFSATLQLQTTTGLKKKENYVFVVQQQDGATFKLRFPEVGHYVFTIYAKAGDVKGRYSSVFTYLVNVSRPTANPKPFPKTYGEWGVGCDVIEPTNGVLPRHQSVHFAVKLPSAVGVATIADGKWTHLKQNADGLWVGDVETGEGDTLSLNAKLDAGKDSYSTVLAYQIQTEKTMKEIDEAAIQVLLEVEERKKKERQLSEERERQFIEATKGLTQAVQTRNIDNVRKAVKLVEFRRFVSRLQPEMVEAKSMVKSLERVQVFRTAVLQLDRKSLQEIRGYGIPPAAVHDVMVAVLLLLGDHEEKTRDWAECQKICSTEDLIHRVEALDVTGIQPETSTRAFYILRQYQVDDVRATSVAAAVFYQWAVGMVQEERLQHNHIKISPPAGITSQALPQRDRLVSPAGITSQALPQGDRAVPLADMDFQQFKFWLWLCFFAFLFISLCISMSRG